MFYSINSNKILIFALQQKEKESLGLVIINRSPSVENLNE